MENAAATVLDGRQTKGALPPGFFPREPLLFRPAVPSTEKCKTNSRPAKRSAPHYLTIPQLDAVQEIITEENELETPCRILAGLNTIFPLNELLTYSSDPFQLLSETFRKWLESFMDQSVLDRLGLSLQIISAEEADYEIFQEAPEADCCIQFGMSDFENGWFPLGDVLDAYDKQFPGLAKYILRMLSGCPLQIGTPEAIYEFASEFCWYGNENEQEIFDERYSEYLESGESEEDANAAALETIMVEYAEFEEYLPEWTFHRDKRKSDYCGMIPEELQKLKKCYDRWQKQRRCHYLFPQYVYPGIVAPLDLKSYDFCCDVINRIGNDVMQCGGDYYFSTLAWPFPVRNTRKMLTVLREIRQTLEYFSACIEFLLAHEKEYPNA